MTVLVHLLHVLLVGLAWWIFKVIQVVHSTRGQPGFVALFQPYSEFGQVFFPMHWRFNLGISLIWKLKTDIYRKYNSNVIVVPSLFPPVVTVLVADAQAINQTNSDHQTFVKDPMSNGSVATLFGPSILTSEGAEWRRHRKVVVSAFSERNTSALWDATVDLVEKWIEDTQARAGEGKEILVKNSEEVWACLALLIMGRAGFGIDFGWPFGSMEEEKSADSSDVPHDKFYVAASSILNNWIPLAFLPKIFLRPFPLTNYIKRAAAGQEVFEKELRQVVAKRVEEVKFVGKNGSEDKHDILTLLCRANVLEDSKSKLSDEELFSDAFVFLIAGHETTAGSLAALFALLAIHPSYQDAIFKEVTAHLEESGSQFTYSSSYRSLPVTLAVVQETLRLAGPAQGLLRRTTVPTELPSRVVGQDGTTAEGNYVKVPSGAFVRQHVQGVHYSDVWEDPESFKPERFLAKGKMGEQMKAFLPFNSGSRGCPGRQFALVESVALVASILLKYKIEIPAHEQEEWALRDGESENIRRDRVLKPLNFFTLAPQDVDLVCVPRE
ncbi:hypothetical protein JCM16303_003983 [Sporobolomyces ruberrimus]